MQHEPHPAQHDGYRWVPNKLPLTPNRDRPYLEPGRSGSFTIGAVVDAVHLIRG